MTERITEERTGGVAHIRLSRPDKLNALDMAMFVALVETGERLAKDRTVRAVVLSGDGRAFCAGLDFSIFALLGGGKAGSENGSLLGRKAQALAPGNLVQQACMVWQAVPAPVIAAVHGVCYGGGLQIALGADMRHVHPETRFSAREIEWGIIPDMSGAQTLRHLVGLDVAKELFFTGRVFSGLEAKELGVATRVSDDPVQSALSMATEIASKSPDAVRACKALLNRTMELTTEAGLGLEHELQLSLLGRPNQLEAVQAGLAKRPPVFTDPE